jgi:hypothetical protein
VTHDPDHERDAGRERADTEFEVLAGPGGPEREHPRAAAVRVRWQRRSVRARAVTAAATVAVPALGGTVAYAATSSNSDDGSSASPSVKDRDTGEWVVRIWQRGTVEKVDGDQVTVKSADGAEWTWTVGSGATAFLACTRSDDDTRTASRVLSGTWEEWKKDRGPGEGRDKFRGPRHWEGRDSEPSKSPSRSGAAAS